MNQWKCSLQNLARGVWLKWKQRVVSLEGHNLVVLYYFGAFEMWPDKKGDFCWNGPYKRDTTIWTNENTAFRILSGRFAKVKARENIYVYHDRLD